MTQKQKMKQVVCPNCGGLHELPVGYQITNHKNVSVCLGILTRRAETAEAEAKAAADRIMVLEVAFANSHELNESLGNENRALTARVAELEAQLAARQHAACPECGASLTHRKLAPF